MMAGTVGDTYSIDLFAGENGAPFVVGSPTVVTLAYNKPNDSTVYTVTPPNLSIYPNSIAFQTNATLFPVGGSYRMQIILGYTVGGVPNATVRKTRVFNMTIQESLA